MLLSFLNFFLRDELIDKQQRTKLSVKQSSPWMITSILVWFVSKMVDANQAAHVTTPIPINTSHMKG